MSTTPDPSGPLGIGPPTSRPPGRRRGRGGRVAGLGVVALLAGLGAGALTAALTGNTDRSPASVGTTSTTAAPSASTPSSTTTSSTTTSSTTTSSTTTTSTPATTTTTTPVPAFTSVSVPSTADCEETPLIGVSWRAAHATGVTISIDGSGIFGTYPASGSAQVPFSCGPASHRYTFSTQGGGPVAREVRTVLQMSVPPTTG